MFSCSYSLSFVVDVICIAEFAPDLRLLFPPSEQNPFPIATYKRPRLADYSQVLTYRPRSRGYVQEDRGESDSSIAFSAVPSERV